MLHVVFKSRRSVFVEWFEIKDAKLSTGDLVMSKTLTDDAASDDSVEIQAAIGKIFADIERNREQMKRDQQEIDRLKARTRAMLAQMETA